MSDNTKQLWRCDECCAEKVITLGVDEEPYLCESCDEDAMYLVETWSELTSK